MTVYELLSGATKVLILTEVRESLWLFYLLNPRLTLLFESLDRLRIIESEGVACTYPTVI